MMRPTKDTGKQWLGNVPQEWELLPLGRIFEERREATNAVDAVPLSVTKRGVVDQLDDVAVSLDGAPKKLVREGDLVINSRSDRKGSSGLSPRDGSVSVINTVLHPVGVDPRYAHHLLRSAAFQEEFYRFGSGIVADLWTTRWTAMKSITMPVPPVAEQRLIADYLDRETAEIDAFLDDQKLLIELLRERRLAQLAREVSGSDSGLAKHDVPWAPGLKTLFPTVNIRRVAEMRTGHTPNRNKPEYWLETHIPWFTLADVWQIRAGGKFLGETTERISSLGLANSAAELLPAGTVVLSRTASVGFTGIMPHPMATSQDYWNWVCGPDILPEYLWFQFRAMRPEFDRIKSGSTHKTIYKADAAAITLVLPPLEDQQEIVQRLTAVDEELAAAEEDVLASIQLAQERRSALISAAVTGQIDVTVQGVSAVERLRDGLEVHV